MAIQAGSARQHWNFFLALEEDIIRLSRLVELVEANFDVYSLEISRILLNAASEVDIVSKLFCRRIDPSLQPQKIDAYRRTIAPYAPLMPIARVTIPKFALELTPWEAWLRDSTPDWWHAHNHVKHERDQFFSDATLKHALNAVSALFLLLLFYYQEEADQGLLQPNPVLFLAGTPFVVDTPFYGGQNYLYQIPKTNQLDNHANSGDAVERTR